MLLRTLKQEPHLECFNLSDLGIQTYGEDGSNDFPQAVDRIINGSVSGMQALSLYSKFLVGQGFSDLAFSLLTINESGETMDDLLRKIARDYAEFGGFALHVNYNALHKITSITHVPFEHVRLGNVDKYGHVSKVALHWDWGHEFGNLRTWKKDDIVYIDLFNSNPAMIDAQVEDAGGWLQYKGQVLYYTPAGLSYPTPMYKAALTDMSTEQGLSNIDNRNARNRFLVGGIVVEIGNDNENTESEDDSYYGDSEGDLQDQLLALQGDDRACKLAYCKVPDKDHVPELVSFQTQNFASEYDSTKTAVKERIGCAFMQPPILRAENVSTGFDTDAMASAYTYYNSITETERYDIERVLRRVFSNWNGENIPTDYAIKPLQWGTTLNNGGLE